MVTLWLFHRLRSHGPFSSMIPMISAVGKGEIFQVFHGHLMSPLKGDPHVPPSRPHGPAPQRTATSNAPWEAPQGTCECWANAGLWAGSGDLDGASKEHDNFSYFSDYMEFPYRLYWDYMGLYGIMDGIIDGIMDGYMGSGWWLSHPSEK